MSLASLLSSVFSPGTTHNGDTNSLPVKIAEYTNEIDGTRQNMSLSEVDQSVAQEEDYELRRPPYLEVHPSSSFAQSVANQRSVHVGGWHWRLDRRHIDALARHREDETARRSPSATEVHLAVKLLHNDLQTGGRAKRTVWRFWCHDDWVLSRNIHVLWDV